MTTRRRRACEVALTLIAAASAPMSFPGLASVAGQAEGGRVVGVVVGDDGRAVAGAEVRPARGGAARVDEQGRFVLAGLAVGPMWIAGVAPGCLAGFSRVSVPASGEVSTRIVVSGAASPVPSGSMAAVTREEMRRRGFRTVYEALRAIAPSMVGHMTGEVGGDRQLSNRSARTFRGAPPVVLLDGIRVPNATRAALESIDVEDLESIEVARGAAAAWRYGPDSAAGAIILTTVRAGAERRAAAADPGNCTITFPTIDP